MTISRRSNLQGKERGAPRAAMTRQILTRRAKAKNIRIPSRNRSLRPIVEYSLLVRVVAAMLEGRGLEHFIWQHESVWAAGLVMIDTGSRRACGGRLWQLDARGAAYQREDVLEYFQLGPGDPIASHSLWIYNVGTFGVVAQLAIYELDPVSTAID